jgi:hypothetical protein
MGLPSNLLDLLGLHRFLETLQAECAARRGSLLSEPPVSKVGTWLKTFSNSRRFNYEGLLRSMAAIPLFVAAIMGKVEMQVHRARYRNY